MRRRRADAAACSLFPTSQDPVKEIARSGFASIRRPPNDPPGPRHEVHDALGNPASRQASTMLHDERGAADAGLTTTVFPQISAGAIFHAGIALGNSTA
jgi:hypothetical protein